MNACMELVHKLLLLCSAITAEYSCLGWDLLLMCPRGCVARTQDTRSRHFQEAESFSFYSSQKPKPDLGNFPSNIKLTAALHRLNRTLTPADE
jgi:hypothetical protein